MKAPVSLLAVCVLSISPAMAAPKAEPTPVMKLTEIDQEGRETPIAGSGRYVDINSKLRVNLEPAEIQRRIIETYGVREPELRLAAIIQFEQDVAEALTSVGQFAEFQGKIHDKGNHVTDAYRKFREKVNPKLRSIVDFAASMAENDEGLSASLNEVIRKSGDNLFMKYNGILSLSPAIAASAKRQADQSIDDSGLYVQLAGTLHAGDKSEPLHFPGFDTNPTGEFHEVARWQVFLSQAELQKGFEVGQQLDKLGKGDVYSKVLKDLITRLQQEARKTIQEIREIIGREVPSTPEFASFQLHAKDARERLDRLDEAVKTFIREYDHPLPAKDFAARSLLLIQLSADAEALVREASATADTLQRTLVDLDALGSQGTPWQPAELHAKLEAFQLPLEQARRGIVDLLAPAQRTNQKFVEFNDKTLKLSLAKLPIVAETDLRRSGPRSTKDTVAIAIRMGRKELEPVELEAYDFQLGRLLLHTEPQAGWVLAQNPKFGNGNYPAPQSGVLMAPAMSVLFKGGSHGSNVCDLLWNDVFTPGIGLNVAALDFNRTGNAEFGIGMEVSILRDWLQGGYGVNLMTREGYLFFSSQLPVDVLRFPFAATSQGILTTSTKSP